MQKKQKIGLYILIFSGIYTLCILSIRCSKETDLTSVSKSKITVLYPGDEYSMNPYGGNSTDHLAFLPLIRTDEKGEVQPLLATHWEHSEDYRTWTVHLRKDVKWQDGYPVTAHDIKFSMELWSHPDVGMSVPSDIITTIDDFTLQINYKKPSRKLLNDWQVFYPKHLLENLDTKEIESWEFWKQPVGNGPYR